MNKKVLQTIGAIVGAFVVVFVLSAGTDGVLEATHVLPGITHPEQMTPFLYLLVLAYRLIYTVLGGYLVALLSKDKPMRNAKILAGIGFAVALLGTIAMWNLGSQWYPILLTILSPLSLLLGAKLRVMQYKNNE